MVRRTLTALTTTAVLLPLVAAPSAAAAASDTLTVHVYDRNGAEVTTQVPAVNLSTGSRYLLTSNTASKLPGGTYVAAAEISSADGTTILGGRTVKVSGSSSTVIDGRKSKPVQVTLNPPVANGGGVIDAQICAGRGYLVTAGALSGKLYVIPNSSKNLQLGYSARWAETGSAGRYTTVGSTSGLPDSFSRTVQRSSLVPVTVTVRSTGKNQYQDLLMSSQSEGCTHGFMTGHSDRDGFRIPMYVSPGKWRLTASAPLEKAVRDRTFAKGGRYSQTFFGAGRGPGQHLPYTLSRNLYFETDSMFADPGFHGTTSIMANGWSFTEGVRTSTALTKGGKTLKKQTRSFTLPYEGRFSHRLPSAGWYGLTVHAKREHPSAAMPAGQISYRTTARFRFHADPAKTQVAPVYLTRFTPAGLSLQNTAKPGSTTNVSLTLDRRGQNNVKPGTAPKVKTMTAWASYDNGTTWKKTTLKKSGSKWVATVKNPKSGYVTLRAKVVDTLGNSSDITIYRAYRIA